MTQDDFLRTICANPDEDLPRLAYSDWLEEHGDLPRAEFLRLQLEMDKLPLGSSQRRQLASRVAEIQEKHETAWLKERNLLCLDLRFRRGLAEMLCLPRLLLKNKNPHLFDWCPVRDLCLMSLNGGVKALAAIPATNQLTDLDLSGNRLDTQALKRLARLENLGGVRRLRLLLNGIDDTGVRVLCQGRLYQQLSEIHCGGNPITREGRQRLTSHFGNRVSFTLERGADHLYRFRTDDYRIIAAILPDQTQALCVSFDSEIKIIRFDAEGALLAYESRPLAGPGYPFRRACRQAIGKHVRGRIAVRRFWLEDGIGIDDFPVSAHHIDQGVRGEWGQYIDFYTDWVKDGSFRFVYNGTDDWWLDRSGEIHTT